MGYVVAGLYSMAFLPTMSQASPRSFYFILVFVRSLFIIGVIVAIVGDGVADEMIRILFGADLIVGISYHQFSKQFNIDIFA